ncbi:MAG: hypothetical protein CM1200mP29_10770 [Verrucomicrobiota bacterium]|nr:MAG: hypothetical protein CM1200mP29_10770 [Verrucomicrobiota bacterium]
MEHPADELSPEGLLLSQTDRPSSGTDTQSDRRIRDESSNAAGGVAPSAST